MTDRELENEHKAASVVGTMLLVLMYLYTYEAVILPIRSITVGLILLLAVYMHVSNNFKKNKGRSIGPLEAYITFFSPIAMWFVTRGLVTGTYGIYWWLGLTLFTYFFSVYLIHDARIPKAIRQAMQIVQDKWPT